MNKKDAIRYHKLAALSNSLLLELDEMQPTAPIGSKLHQKTKEFTEALEPFLSSTYEMLARSLWCNLDLAEARETLRKGLTAWPENELLQAEQREMILAAHALPAGLTHN
jgi:hypothetical protein